MFKKFRPLYLLVSLFFLSTTIMLVFQRHLFGHYKRYTQTQPTPGGVIISPASNTVQILKPYEGLLKTTLHNLKKARLLSDKKQDKKGVIRKVRTESFLGKTQKISMFPRKRLYNVNSTSKRQSVKLPPKKTDVSKRKKTNGTRGSYGGYQIVNDKMTFVYAGYYDDRDKKAVVKVITIAPRDIKYNFTCTLSYHDQREVRVRGYIKYHNASCCGFYSKELYKDAFIICPVSRSFGRPSFVLIHKEGKEFPKTKVIVRAPSAQRNTLTLCGKPFLKNYDRVAQIVWNIELLRLYGVDKFIFYLDSQSQSVVDMFQAYEREGLVELRNVSIRQPGSKIHKLTKLRNYGQFAVHNDCILSQMYTSKYLIFIDVDEVVVPRQHRTIVDLAEDLFNESEHAKKHVGSLVFRNVYFPAYLEKTKTDYPRKELALKYDIEPLLFTTRLGSSDLRISPKTIVRPLTVDVMCVHHVEKFRPGWHRKVVGEDVAFLHHYRNIKAQYMFPPESQDTFILKMADQLISAVDERFERTGIKS